MDYEKKNIEIPFGAFDSELGCFEYTIPDGYEAEIKDGKVIVRKAESEDEKIRGAIIDHLKDHNLTEWLAWLEKQGDKDKLIEELGEYKAKYIQEVLQKHLEEQKPFDYENANIQQKDFAPKIEPKFKVGDWLVHKDLVGVTCCITQIHAPHYYLTNNNSFIKFGEEDNYRPWTIEDAKDGDVLVASDDSIFLFKGTIYCACIHYVALATNGAVKFNEGLEHCWETSRAVHPATKEQRELLFQKMYEAGYEWGAEKKELKKIEEKPAWSEEDEKYVKDLADYFTGVTSLKHAEEDIADWLKSLKDRYTWKPSGEQMKALDIAIRAGIQLGSWEETALTELLTKLKAL